MANEIIVEVLDDQAGSREGTFENDKGDEISYSVRTQPARLECNGFAYPYNVRLEKDQPPYAKGRYRLAVEHMLAINKGSHSLGKYTKLQPLQAVK